MFSCQRFFCDSRAVPVPKRFLPETRLPTAICNSAANSKQLATQPPTASNSAAQATCSSAANNQAPCLMSCRRALLYIIHVLVVLLLDPPQALPQLAQAQRLATRMPNLGNLPLSNGRLAAHFQTRAHRAQTSPCAASSCNRRAGPESGRPVFRHHRVDLPQSLP